MKSSRTACMLLIAALLFAGCTEMGNSSNTSAPSSAPEIASSSSKENKAIQIHEDISIEFLQDSLLDIFTDLDAEILEDAQIQYLDGLLYYFSVAGENSSLIKSTLDGKSKEVIFTTDKAVGDFAIAPNGLLYANVIRPIGDFEQPSPEYPLGMYIYNMEDGSFISGAEYYSLEEGSIYFSAYSDDVLYVFISVGREQDFYRDMDGKLEKVSRSGYSTVAFIGDTVLYTQDKVIYASVSASEPIPVLRMHTSAERVGIELVGKSFIFEVPSDKNSWDSCYINFDMQNEKIIGMIELRQEDAKVFLEDRCQRLIVEYEQVGGSHRAIEAYLEIYTWDKEVIATYPPFENPSYLFYDSNIMIDDLLYYVDMGTSPSTLKVLYPLEAVSEAA